MSRDWNLRINERIDGDLHLGAARGLSIAGEYVLGEARKTVPIEEFTLGRSGTVSVDREGLRAAVSFDTPY
jgi:hypothetical protein